MGNAAGFWRRLGAAFIDGILLNLVADAIARVLGWDASPYTWTLAGGNVVWVVLSLAYFTYLHGTYGQTAGDAAMSIRVGDIETGEVIGLQRAFLRWLMSIVSAVAIVLGYLWMLWDPERQTWHDKVARSLPFVQATRSAQSP
jgi:uncharacterized RDD family membrane protein YckC